MVAVWVVRMSEEAKRGNGLARTNDPDTSHEAIPDRARRETIAEAQRGIEESKEVG